MFVLFISVGNSYWMDCFMLSAIIVPFSTCSRETN